MGWYEKRYKALFIVPLILLILSIGAVVYTTAQYGSFVQKGVSLSGGVSTTVTLGDDIDTDSLEESLRAAFPQASIEVRRLSTFADEPTFVVDAAGIGADEQEGADVLSAHLESTYSVQSISVETTGPSLGEAFFIQTIIGILLAFLWMGWVVFLYFGENLVMKVGMAVIAFVLTMLAVQGVIAGTTGVLILSLLVLASMIVYFLFSVPSGAVILAAASTIVFTLAVIDLAGIKLSTAGVAAFLMLIGYSVDTDILLSTRVLKNPQKTLNQRISSAFKTGITMQLTTSVAVAAAYFLSSSEVIKQIMLIILIGMAGDIIFTWLQNAGIIYWYVQRTEKSPVVQAAPVAQKPVPGTRKRRRRRRKKK